MTKTQLRTQKVNEGWKVPAIEDWKLVSAVGLEPKKYDISNVFNPHTESFMTATVVVYDEGTVDEKAVGQNKWKPDFRDELYAFVRSMEQGNIWGITINEIFEEDQIAYVTALIQSTNVASKEQYFIRKRGDEFSYIKQA